MFQGVMIDNIIDTNNHKASYRKRLRSNNNVNDKHLVDQENKDGDSFQSER